MSRPALSPLASFALLALVGCSSWDTGSASVDDTENACLATIETFARTAERCERDYKTSYDAFLRRDAAGDCKNIKGIRDEAALRDKCLPSVRTQSCPSFEANTFDPSCSKQLRREQ
jgi:hypothetical protein